MKKIDVLGAKQIIACLLFASLNGCSREKSSDEKFIFTKSSTRSDGEADKVLAGLEKVTQSTIASQSELHLQALAPQLLLLDASNLESVYKPIFGLNGQMTPTDARYFTPEDKAKLGEYALLSIPNVVTARTGARLRLSQDYLFALRSFAARACENLVKAEKAAPDNMNKLVWKSDVDAQKVSEQALNSFMSGLFGYSPQNGAMHSGATEMAAIFNAAVMSRGWNAAFEDNYKLACVYMATDPRAFSR